MEAASEVRGSRSSAAMAAWAHRPGDITFDSVDQLVTHTEELKDRSFVMEAAVEHLAVQSGGDSLNRGADEMYLIKDGKPALFNNHSFNQFCQNIGARAGEYRKLPSAIAQIPLTWMSQNCDRKDVKILATRDEDDKILCRSINSPTYGRIWNHELAKAVKDHIDPDVWTLPEVSHFHTNVGFISTNDRKAFIFLVNEKNPIQLKGMEKPMYRGFYAWNSEVGDGTAGYADFLFNSVCANRAMIGVSDFQELIIRHTAGAPDRWLKEAVPTLNEYVNSSTEKVAGLLEASRNKSVAKDEKGALQWLQERGFTKALAKSTIESAREEERGADPSASPYCVFNLIQGATAEARAKANNDERVAIELMAGKMMKAVA